jgi:hypothetical protein
MNVLKTKLGIASTVALRTPDGSKSVHAFHCTGTGRALNFDQSANPPRPAFRAALLASRGRYPGRPPFRAVYGLVGGAGRIVIYDLFGMAVSWEGSKLRVRRRGMSVQGEPQAILEALWALPAATLGHPGAYVCPACSVAPIIPPPVSEYLRIPLCVKCTSRGTKERDWVGSYQCFRCGDRVKEEEEACPFCAILDAERGG